PKALGKVTGPELRPAPAPAPPRENERFGEALVVVGFVALAAVFAGLLRKKMTLAAAAAACRGATSRMLVRIPLLPYAYGACASGALAMLHLGDPLLGSILVAIAMALAAHRSPLVPHRPRGPGQW